MDGYFERIAEEHVTLCAKVLEATAETSQVILLANRQSAFLGRTDAIFGDVNVTHRRIALYPSSEALVALAVD